MTKYQELRLLHCLMIEANKKIRERGYLDESYKYKMLEKNKSTLIAFNDGKIDFFKALKRITA